MIIKNIPLILARTEEMAELKSKSKEENELLRKIKSDPNVQEFLPKTVSRNTANMNLKPILLIAGHLFDLPEVRNPIFS